MEEEGETLAINPNLSCNVCGDKEFEEREGFYYCLECGTKQDQVRLIDVDHGLEFDEAKMLKTQKIIVAKAEKPQLTSWECYNYILRGFVEELLSFGAKEELKLMTLQVWAAYLRRMEVAFFNKKQADLPKLGIRYFQNDAETIYNHTLEARRKRKRKRGDDTSCTSANESMTAKDWRKSKRKLDESIYSLTSASGVSGITSSTSANSNKGIRLGFNYRARKFFKKQMPVHHLKKHEIDADGVLECHKQPKTRDINTVDYAMMLMNSKQIYCVLAVALNLIGDEIQLCDLLRFIHEGYLGHKNVMQYFPENIASNGKEMLRKINFYKTCDKYSDKALREHISLVCRNIGIHKHKSPDLIALVRRYIKELCLPLEVATYIERLINILPPQFDSRAIGVYPAYEARAMAYILFVLKLLFGLDGDKELKMSQASKQLNHKIAELNRRNVGGPKQPLLFVWSEWVEYIEMRKIIVSHFNPSFCEQFNQCQSSSQLLEQMAEEIRRNEEHDALSNDPFRNQNMTHKMDGFKTLFHRFQENFQNQHPEESKKSMKYIEFKPTFTPALSYFKSILLHCDCENSLSANSYFKIPDFMRTDHSQRDINSYLQVKPLIEYFQKQQKELKVYVLPTNKNRSYVGIFRPPRAVFHGAELHLTRAQKACFDVTEEDWAENLVKENVNTTDDLEFKRDLDRYAKRYMGKLSNLTKKRNKLFNPSMNYDISLLHDDDDENKHMENDSNIATVCNSEYRKKLLNSSEGNDIHSLHSFDLFQENNMDPMENEDLLNCPRRNLDQYDIFDGISDEESVLNDADENVINERDESKSNSIAPSGGEDVVTSSQEEFLDIKIENANESDGDSVQYVGFEKPQKQKPSKLYISNMECWTLLGSISKLKKGQKIQLQDQLPRSFAWLLETCSQTLSVEWLAVYEQLLAIELMFCLGIEDPTEIKDCVYMKFTNEVKDFQMLVNNYREIW